MIPLEIGNEPSGTLKLGNRLRVALFRAKQWLQFKQTLLW
jgi:hypothetical protein